MKPVYKSPSLDTVTSINEDGSRYMIHPADVQGRFTQARRVVALVLVLVYLSLPFIPVGGYPAVFLDLDHGRFHLLGLTFVAQDLVMVFFLITGFGFSLYVITSLFGRIWCGWACPQTVFMEQVYRKIERWIEGDAMARRRLDQSEWTAGKLFRRILKHTLFWMVSAVIAHLFLAYFVSPALLAGMLLHGPRGYWMPFFLVSGMTLILYFNFAWFREQFCVILCPYGRFQSALIDEHSVVIGYDEKRGEPRGRVGTEGAGSCIDCRRCVQVCPTGIDIRQGLQIECIGCANCIDACDAVMDKLKRPRGLVRYASQKGLAGQSSSWFRPRLLLYGFLMILGLAVLSFSSGRFQSALFWVNRLPGIPYVVTEGKIRNMYQVRLINKKHVPQSFRLKVSSGEIPFEQHGFESLVLVGPEAEESQTLVLVVRQEDYRKGLEFEMKLVSEDETLYQEKHVVFIGPDF